MKSTSLFSLSRMKWRAKRPWPRSGQEQHLAAIAEVLLDDLGVEAVVGDQTL